MFKKITIIVVMLGIIWLGIANKVLISPIKADGNYKTLRSVNDSIMYTLPVSAVITTVVIEDYWGMAQFAASYLASGIITAILKHLVGEPRPYQHPEDRGESFPSGHATAAFGVSWFFWRRYGYIAGVIATIVAVFVGSVRVIVGAHYIHDIIGSAILTFFMACIMVRTRKLNTVASKKLIIKYK